ncbi:MAG: Uma2 family endonuclease [Bryobacterales bacterium]|nr:Uma2 family endonuclease [Bryobacterales bacterium]
MSAKTALGLEEYLATAYEGPDPEYVDGELMERAMPGFEHGETVARLVELFAPARKTKPAFPTVEIRIAPSSDRVRVLDFAVFWPERPSGTLPERPPLVIAEVLSPTDPMDQVQQRLSEFVEWGVRHVWLVDPRRRFLYLFERTGLRSVPKLTVPELEVELGPADIFD